MSKRITVYLTPEGIDALRTILEHEPSFSLSRHIREQVCRKSGQPISHIVSRGKKMSLPKTKYANLYFDDTSLHALHALKSKPGGFSLRHFVNAELVRLAQAYSE